MVLNRCVAPKIYCRLYREYVCSIHLDFGNCTKNSKGHLVFQRVSQSKFISFNCDNILLHLNLDSFLKLQAQISLCIWDKYTWTTQRYFILNTSRNITIPKPPPWVFGLREQYHYHSRHLIKTLHHFWSLPLPNSHHSH